MVYMLDLKTTFWTSIACATDVIKPWVVISAKQH